MPVYESIKNADNKIVISARNKDSVVFGWDKVVAALADKVAAGAKVIALDGWYGIDGLGKILYCSGQGRRWLEGICFCAQKVSCGMDGCRSSCYSCNLRFDRLCFRSQGST